MPPNESNRSETRKAWGGVFALSLTAFALVASEFMPVSLLTPIAATLKISAGAAGQAIAVSGAFALLSSLSITTIARRLDRKVLLLSLTLLMMVSGLIVSFSPNYVFFMLGRALLGIAIGGFWSMSAATAMRLVPEEQVSRAFAILNGGNALATVIAAPLGSFLGSVIGWRGAFFCVVPLAVLTFGWQWISLPSLKVGAESVPGNIFLLLKRPAVAWGLIANSVMYVGQFMLFTYLRPFLEVETRVSISQLSVVLLVMGAAGFAGTMLIGKVLGRGLFRTLIAIPLLMAAIALTLTRVGASFPLTFLLLTIWGFLATSAPVGWWIWLAKTLPTDAEAGGGLLVAVVQLAISLGATLGGLAYDAHGYRLTFETSSAILIASACLTLVAARARSPLSRSDAAMQPNPWLCTRSSWQDHTKFGRVTGCSGEKMIKKQEEEFEMTRRGFLVAGAAVAASGLPALAKAEGAAAPAKSQGENVTKVSLDVNGRKETLLLDTRTTLLDALREHLHQTGTKKGCDHGQCGACTVLVNGRRMNSCLTLAIMHAGDKVTTIEGLGTPDKLHPMQAAFIKHDGYQCGYCTPGQICSAVGTLGEIKAGVPSHVSIDLTARPQVTEIELRERMSGNICRCAAYPNIIDAITEVSRRNA